MREAVEGVTALARVTYDANAAAKCGRHLHPALAAAATTDAWR